MLDMAKRQILPAGMEFAKKLADSVVAKKAADINYELEKKLADKVSALNAGISAAIDELDSSLIGVADAGDAEATAVYYRSSVFAAMQNLRAVADELETITPEKMWPFPTYGDLLFKV